MIYAAPGAAGAKIAYKAQYDNFINGKWVAPVKGQYFDVVTPVEIAAQPCAAPKRNTCSISNQPKPKWHKPLCECNLACHCFLLNFNNAIRFCLTGTQHANYQARATTDEMFNRNHPLTGLQQPFATNQSMNRRQT